MKNSLGRLMEESRTINSKTISLTRCLILTYLAYSDGLQYRELKAALNMSDGKLMSNIKQLVLMGYIKKAEVKLYEKKLDVYSLTKGGSKELKKMGDWMDLINNVVDENLPKI